MFTGIVTDIGIIRTVERRGDTRFTIATTFDTASIAIGASIACSGACMTVVEKSDSARATREGSDWFAIDVSAESLSRTTIGDWRAGTRINLERSLRMGDELGGHWVTGHVDGVGQVEQVEPEGDSLRIVITPPADLLPFIAEKGSITVDGVSLTVNNVDERHFYLNIIPHTQQVTTLGSLGKSGAVNLEVDMVARYLKRLLPHGLK